MYAVILKQNQLQISLCMDPIKIKAKLASILKKKQAKKWSAISQNQKKNIKELYPKKMTMGFWGGRGGM